MLELHAALKSMHVDLGALKGVEEEIERLERGLEDHIEERDEVGGWGRDGGRGVVGRGRGRSRERSRSRAESNSAVVDGGGLGEGSRSRSKGRSAGGGRGRDAAVGDDGSRREAGIAKMRGGRGESPATSRMPVGREQVGLADDKVYEASQRRHQDVAIATGSKTGRGVQKDVPRCHLRKGWRAYIEELVEHKVEQRLAEGKDNRSHVQNEECIGSLEYAKIAPREREQPPPQATAEKRGSGFSMRGKNNISKTGGFMRWLVKTLQDERPQKPELRGSGRDPPTARTSGKIPVSAGNSRGETSPFTNDEEIPEHAGHVDVVADCENREPAATKDHGEGNDDVNGAINGANHHSTHEDDESFGGANSVSSMIEHISELDAATANANQRNVEEDDESSQGTSSVSSMSDDVSELDAAEEALGHGHAAPAAEGDRSAPAMPSVPPPSYRENNISGTSRATVIRSGEVPRLSVREQATAGTMAGRLASPAKRMAGEWS